MDRENSGVPMVEGLFGPQPLERVKGRGRPAHVWERRISARICSLFACGHTVETVARTVGISQPTLRKVYFSEVADREIMLLKIKSEQFARLIAQAEGGSVPAEKALAAMLHAERLNVQAQHMAATPKREARPAKLGKKEEAKISAHGVGGMFAPPAPPSLQ